MREGPASVRLWWKNINTMRMRQNGCHFASHIFNLIFYYENCRFFIKISLHFVPKVSIDNKSSLVQIMAWHQTDSYHVCAWSVTWMASFQNLVLLLQLNAVITRPNIVRYYINDCKKSGRVSIRCRIHKWHPIPCPNGRAIGCLLWFFF